MPKYLGKIRGYQQFSDHQEILCDFKLWSKSWSIVPVTMVKAVYPKADITFKDECYWWRRLKWYESR